MEDCSQREGDEEEIKESSQHDLEMTPVNEMIEDSDGGYRMIFNSSSQAKTDLNRPLTAV